MRLVNPFESGGKWYKANLHCHTTSSDGEATCEECVEQYRGAGYDVLAITDHGITNDVAGLSDEDFLVISGVEAHPRVKPDCHYHLVCLNVPTDIELSDDCAPDECADIVNTAGGLVIIGHPYWSGHDINEMLAVKDFVAIEVFNKQCGGRGKSISSVHWDNLLCRGKSVSAVAVDDTHYKTDPLKLRVPGSGWTHIKARELTVQAVIEAIGTGCYYASCGPIIEDFRVADRIAKVKCSPVKEIHFMAQRCYGESFYAEEGDLMTAQQLALHEQVRYVRAEVVDEEGKRAWSNPIVLSQWPAG